MDSIILEHSWKKIDGINCKKNIDAMRFGQMASGQIKIGQNVKVIIAPMTTGYKAKWPKSS